MSITDRHIRAGDVIYQVTPKGMKRVGTAKTKGTVKIQFVRDPTFVIAGSSDFSGVLQALTLFDRVTQRVTKVLQA